MGNGGDTFDLQTVDIKIQTQEFCSLTSEDVLVVCAADTGKDSCQGDSGGPLVGNFNGVRKLYGTVAYGSSKCGQGKLFGVYTKVPKYLQWIKDTLEGRAPTSSTSSTFLNFFLVVVLALFFF